MRDDRRAAAGERDHALGGKRNRARATGRWRVLAGGRRSRSWQILQTGTAARRFRRVASRRRDVAIVVVLRDTAAPGKTRLFYRWQGAKLTDKDWQPMGIAMEADPGFGETEGGLQAPFVMKHNSEYLMFYGDWDHICRRGVSTARRSRDRYK